MEKIEPEYNDYESALKANEISSANHIETLLSGNVCHLSP